MVTCVITNLRSKISTGPAMSLICHLSQAISLSIPLRNCSQQTLLKPSSQPLFSISSVASCSSNKITCFLLPATPLTCVRCHSHSLCPSSRKAATVLWRACSPCACLLLLLRTQLYLPPRSASVCLSTSSPSSVYKFLS